MGHKLNCTILVSELCDMLGLTYGEENCSISGVTALSDPVEGFLAYARERSSSITGMVAIVPSFLADEKSDITTTCIYSSNPRLDFIRALSYLQEAIGFSSNSGKSVIHDSVVIGQNVVIEDGCVISEGVVIEHNVVIHSGTRIGRNSRVRSCSSIGGDGFGFERLADGTPVRFPHLGNVVIGENVEIGACTTIARGTLSSTVIEDFAKIDNLVHIAHNCKIRKGAFVIACSEVSGGVEIGENAWIAPNSCILEKRVVGENALIGIGAVVIKDVPPNTVYAGNPAKWLGKVK